MVRVLVHTPSMSGGGLVLSAFVHFYSVNNNIFTPQGNVFEILQTGRMYFLG